MIDLRIRIRLRSHLGTPWQSDTVFGHLCWQVVYGVIDLGIEEFLKPFREGRPPFVLSDGFPAGFLPRPMSGRTQVKASSRAEYASLKRWRKAALVTVEDFLLMRHGEAPRSEPRDDPWASMMTPHAALDRNSLTTGGRDEGGFFETECLYLREADPPGHLDLYVRYEDVWRGRIESLFASLSQTGFGRDKSIGMGAFECVDIAPFDGFAPIDGANGYVSLSSIVPGPCDPTDARFRLRLKAGKLAEGLSANPFKRPLLQMEPGAVFRTSGPPPPYCGRLVTNIAPGRIDIVQNCYGISVPWILPE